MDYPSESSAGLQNGKFTDGDPVNNIPPSPDRAAYMNAVYDELRNAIIAGGETPDKAKLNQLATVIAKAMTGGKVLGQAFWHQGETPPAGAMQYRAQILNRITHSALWNALNEADRNITWVTQAEAGARPGCWHTGDGSTTFGAPSVPDEFLRVWNSAGSRLLGSHQDDQSLHVDGFQTVGNIYPSTVERSIPTDGSYSGYSETGQTDGGTGTAIRMKMNGAETYPKNTAWMLCFWYE